MFFYIFKFLGSQGVLEGYAVLSVVIFAITLALSALAALSAGFFADKDQEEASTDARAAKTLLIHAGMIAIFGVMWIPIYVLCRRIRRK